jgi:hypothetical protein
MDNMIDLVSGTLAHIARNVNLPEDDQHMILLVLMNIRDLIDGLIKALEAREGTNADQ